MAHAKRPMLLCSDMRNYLVPPGRPTIFDALNRAITTHEVGPFEVGEDLEVACTVQGGKRLFESKEKSFKTERHRVFF